MISINTRKRERITPVPIEIVSASTPPITPIKPKKHTVAIIARTAVKMFFDESFSIKAPRASRAVTLSDSLDVFIMVQLLL